MKITSFQKPIAVIAGTYVDTSMGTELLLSKGLDAHPYPVSIDATAQNLFQFSPIHERTRHVMRILNSISDSGIRHVFIYCNSLSGAVDFDMLKNETGLHIVTPLDIYKLWALNYRNLALIAANAQGLSGIESVLYSANKDLHILGVDMLGAVNAIEAKFPPEEIIKRFNLVGLCGWFSACHMEAVILGCTHFPYFKDSLSQYTALPLLDPAEEMIRMLTA